MTGNASGRCGIWGGGNIRIDLLVFALAKDGEWAGDEA